MNKSKNLTFNYSLLQVFYWMGFGTILAFSSAYLLASGLTSGMIGVIIAVSSAVSSLLQPVVAAYADKPDSLSLRVIIIILSVLTALTGAVLLINNARSLAVCIIFYCLSAILLQTLQPMINAISMASVNQGYRLNFGATRAVGSTGYAILSWAIGLLVASCGSNTIPVSIILCFGLLALFTFLYPFRKQNAAAAASAENSDKAPAADPSGSPVLFFRNHRRYMFMLLGMIFVFISHVLINNFTLQIVMAKGGGSAEMGTATAIAALSELPIMLLFTLIARKVKTHVLVRIAPVFFFLKTLLSLLVSTITGFYCIQVFQMLGWALYSVVIVYYVNEIMAPQDAVKGQAYATMAYTLSSVFAALIGGAMIDTLGVNAMLIFGSISAAIGSVIVFFCAEKTEK